MADERVSVKVEVLGATYFKGEGVLTLDVLTPSGEKRSCTIPASNRFKGRTLSEPEMHEQMFILANLINKAKGRRINMIADGSQIYQG